MGQQYLENLDMYKASQVIFEARSETAANFHKCEAAEFANFVFNKQYGIFYYEPASEKEAQDMIDSFERKIEELKRRYLNVSVQNSNVP